METVRLKRLGGIILLIGLVVAALTGHRLYGHGMFRSDFVSTNGIVADQFTSRDPGREEPVLHLKVGFAAVDGEVHIVSREVSDEFWRTHPKDSTMVVIYRQGHPLEARIPGSAGEEEKTLWYGAAAAALLMLGALILSYERWRSGQVEEPLPPKNVPVKKKSKPRK